MHSYGVSFMMGTGGVWIAWLINQHQDFPQCSLNLESEFAGVELENGIGAFHYGNYRMTRRLFPNDSESESDSDFISKMTNNLDSEDSAANPTFTKYSFKIRPDHGAGNCNKKLHRDIENFPKNVTFIILNSEVAKYNKFFIKRREYLDMHREKYDILKENALARQIRRYNLNVRRFYKTCIRYDIPCEVFDAGKLTFGDVAEYHRLCEYLKQPPLPNYLELVDKSIQDVWHKFM
jgi:hypothetical protein